MCESMVSWTRHHISSHTAWLNGFICTLASKHFHIAWVNGIYTLAPKVSYCMNECIYIHTGTQTFSNCLNGSIVCIIHWHHEHFHFSCMKTWHIHWHHEHVLISLHVNVLSLSEHLHTSSTLESQHSTRLFKHSFASCNVNNAAHYMHAGILNIHL